MVRLARGAVVAALALLVGGFVVTPSFAAEDAPVAPTATAAATQEPVYGCLDPVDAYGAPRACQLNVTVLAPVCSNDVPLLTYDVQPIGTPNTTVKITFVNPNGASVVYADQPLKGTVPWPGAVVGPDGKGIDWPGWTKLADGTWVQGDEFDWALPTVQVLFEVNPSATMAVSYPPSTPTCKTGPEVDQVLADDGTVVPASNQTSAVLSATGSNVAPVLFAAIGFLVVGAGIVTLVTISRRRRQDV